MRPHPEGGHYVETWRHHRPDGGRGAGTAIYYLLQAGERSHWHRVDATEIWHWYAGAPLELSLSTDGVAVADALMLGNDLASGARTARISTVPAGRCGRARLSTGAGLDTPSCLGPTPSSPAPQFEFCGPRDGAAGVAAPPRV